MCFSLYYAKYGNPGTDLRPLISKMNAQAWKNELARLHSTHSEVALPVETTGTAAAGWPAELLMVEDEPGDEAGESSKRWRRPRCKRWRRPRRCWKRGSRMEVGCKTGGRRIRVTRSGCMCTQLHGMPLNLGRRSNGGRDRGVAFADGVTLTDE
jgi:hypothetical protein